MDILYVVNNFPSLSESFVINEISELERRGHNVVVFAQNDPEESFVHDELKSLDIPVRYHSWIRPSEFHKLISKPVISSRVIRRTFYQDGPKDLALWLDCGRQISQYIEDIGGVGVIHAHFARKISYASLYAGAYHNIPCTVTAHAYDIFKSPDRKFLKKYFDYVDEVVVPSNYNARYLREKFEIKKPITVVPATNSVEKFSPTKETVSNRVLTVARLVEKKGYEYSIRAIKKLVDSGHNIDYHIVGTGPKELQLKEFVAKLDLEDHVTFLSNVSDQQLKDEYSEAAVFVLGCVIADDGDRDAMPVVLKEAMSVGTPCVSTTVSAIPELITDNRDGLLVPPNDPDSLADSVEKLLTDKQERNRIAENASETVHEKFDIEDSVDDLVEVFERCSRERR